MSFRKHGSRPGATAWEAAGLRWLAATDTVPVVRVVSVDDHVLELESLTSVSPTRGAAEQFGRALARLHRVRAAGWGSPPRGWTGDGWLGPNDDLLVAPMRSRTTWAGHWLEDCLLPVARVCVERGRADAGLVTEVERLGTRLSSFETADDPCPVHGDLWSGNVLWTPQGATMIDCSAHGGHRELDLALLHLFGFPHLGRVMGAYAEEFALADGWRERIGLHQLHHLLVHVACFGGGYLAQTREVLRTL